MNVIAAHVSILPPNAPLVEKSSTNPFARNGPPILNVTANAYFSINPHEVHHLLIIVQLSTLAQKWRAHCLLPEWTPHHLLFVMRPSCATHCRVFCPVRPTCKPPSSCVKYLNSGWAGTTVSQSASRTNTRLILDSHELRNSLRMQLCLNPHFIRHIDSINS